MIVRLSGLMLPLRLMFAQGAYAQTTSTDYHLLGVVREMPAENIVVDGTAGSSYTAHEITVEILQSDPPLWGGATLRVQYKESPSIDGRALLVGDLFLFTLQKNKDPIHIEWDDIAAHAQQK